ncbi:MAG: thioredoxin family protein [Gammaproteobacteria bacterium]|nr:thioredoxin family protein [Gammaproteobacteria bacterium]
MKVQVYMTAICPRCLYISRILKELNQIHPELEIEYIEMLTDFKRFTEAGIKIFPAIVIGDDMRAWVMPKKSEIVNFIEQSISSSLSEAEIG